MSEILKSKETLQIRITWEVSLSVVSVIVRSSNIRVKNSQETKVAGQRINERARERVIKCTRVCVCVSGTMRETETDFDCPSVFIILIMIKAAGDCELSRLSLDLSN